MKHEAFVKRLKLAPMVIPVKTGIHYLQNFSIPAPIPEYGAGFRGYADFLRRH